MPWKETSKLEQRKELIQRCLAGEESVAELSRQYGVSRETVYQWLRRWEEEGEQGLEERSRAPHQQARAISEAMAEEILGVRRAHPRWGPRKILGTFDRGRQDLPAASTVGALLKREGLVVGRRKRQRVPAYTAPLAHALAPNQVWCADFKGWFLCGDGERCDPLTVTDACSRYLLRCRHVSKTDGAHVRSVFETVFREYGMPEAIRTDNGAPFASSAPGGLSRVSMWWLKLGIRHERIEPGCPQQNGRHERMHQTLKQETADPPSANLRRQQESFGRFEEEYNYQRPHEALENRKPAEVYEASQRVYPSRLPELEYPPGAHLRWVSQQGSVKWKCERAFVSEVLAREVVGLLEVEEELFEVYYGPLMLGWLDGREGVFWREQKPTKRSLREKQKKTILKAHQQDGAPIPPEPPVATSR
jgi:transposase InsO family protein